MPLVVALAFAVAFVVVLWCAMGRDPGPTAVDAAVSYALARARGDWSSVYDLSGTELRGGHDRKAFVAAHGAHATDAGTRRGPERELRAHVEQATVLSDVATVVVHVGEPAFGLRLDCEKRSTRWVVTAAALA